MVKMKKFLALSMTFVTVAASAMTAWALDMDLENNSGSTEVTASIEDEQAGAVQFTVTVPDKVDFGKLTPPETDEDSFKDVSFDVTLKSVENLGEDQYVEVRVKDQNATEVDSSFYMTQKTSPNTSFIYYVYNTSTIEDYSLPLTAAALTDSNGYFFTAFNQAGQKETGTLRFNQKQLYGKDLSEIAGDYSGSMVYTISIRTV